MAPAPILLVDDSKEDIELTRLALEEAGARGPVEEAHDGSEAIERLGRGPAPRLVLLDLRMPRVDGLEVLRWARAQPALEAVPIVVLTTSNLERDRKTAAELGATSYFEKPVDFDATVRLAKKVLSLASGKPPGK